LGFSGILELASPSFIIRSKSAKHSGGTALQRPGLILGDRAFCGVWNLRVVGVAIRPGFIATYKPEHAGVISRFIAERDEAQVRKFAHQFGG